MVQRDHLMLNAIEAEHRPELQLQLQCALSLSQGMWMDVLIVCPCSALHSKDCQLRGLAIAIVIEPLQSNHPTSGRVLPLLEICMGSKEPSS